MTPGVSIPTSYEGRVAHLLPLRGARPLMGINRYRWLECIGPRLELVGGLNISGGRPIETKVLAVVDENREDRIEMTLSIPTTPGTVIRR